MLWVELAVLVVVVVVFVAEEWGFAETAPLRPSTGHAGTADDHTIAADAATQAKNRHRIHYDWHAYTKII